jgi:hypothetical protein
VQDAKKCRDKEQRRNGRENQSTYYRPTERSILFTAVAQSEGHWDHPNNHGQGRHQYGPKACEARFQRSTD